MKHLETRGTRSTHKGFVLRRSNRRCSLPTRSLPLPPPTPATQPPLPTCCSSCFSSKLYPPSPRTGLPALLPSFHLFPGAPAAQRLGPLLQGPHFSPTPPKFPPSPSPGKSRLESQTKMQTQCLRRTFGAGEKMSANDQDAWGGGWGGGKQRETRMSSPGPLRCTPPLPHPALPRAPGTSLASGLWWQAHRRTAGRSWPRRQEAGGQARAMAPRGRFVPKEMNKIRKIKQTQTL